MRVTFPARIESYGIPVLGIVLLLVLSAIIYLEFQQRTLLSNTLRYEEDNIAWNFFQLDRNLLQLQNRLRQKLGEPDSIDADQLQLRLDIFANQADVIAGGTAIRSLARYYANPHAVDEIAFFISEFGIYFQEGGAEKLDPDAIRRMLPRIEQLQLLAHDLSLSANQMMLARSVERVTEVKRQINVSTGLVLFQFLLVLFFSWMVLRQMRQLDKRAAALSSALEQADRSYAELSSYMQAIDQHALVTVVDPDWRISYANDSFCKISGYSREELQGQQLGILKSPLQSERLFPTIREKIANGENWHGEVCYQTRNGLPFWLDSTFVSIRDARGKVARYLSVSIDNTDKKQAEDRTSYLTVRDELTGLANLVLLQDRIGQALEHEQRKHHRAAVLLIDLDHFKAVNDRLSHQAGDVLLKEAATRVVSLVERSDTVARQSGDEFYIFLRCVPDAVYAKNIAGRLLAALAEPFRIEDQDVAVTASIGIALYPDDGMDAQTLLSHSDIAMHHAKAAGRNQYHCFTSRPPLLQATPERQA